MADGTEDRLFRIEEKIDKLTDLTVSLARVESRLEDLEDRRLENHERVNRLSKSMDDINNRTLELDTKVNVGVKALWFLAAAVTTSILANMGFVPS